MEYIQKHTLVFVEFSKLLAVDDKRCSILAARCASGVCRAAFPSGLFWQWLVRPRGAGSKTHKIKRVEPLGQCVGGFVVCGPDNKFISSSSGAYTAYATPVLCNAADPCGCVYHSGPPPKGRSITILDPVVVCAVLPEFAGAPCAQRVGNWGGKGWSAFLSLSQSHI